jgi:hypothetical protein
MILPAPSPFQPAPQRDMALGIAGRAPIGAEEKTCRKTRSAC